MSLTGAGSVTIGGATTWTGGIMSGSGQTTTNGSLAITANNTAELDGRTLNINGSTTLTGTSNFWRGSNGAVVNNAGLFDVQSDARDPAHLTSLGPCRSSTTWRPARSASRRARASRNVEFVFNNSGAVEVEHRHAQPESRRHEHGQLHGATTATLVFGGGTSDITHNSMPAAVSGAGTVRFSGGTTNFNGGTYNVTGTTQATGGIGQFQRRRQRARRGRGPDRVDGFGNLNFSSGEAINVTTLNMSAGTLSGSDNLTISGATTWTGGIMAGSGQTTTNGSLAITANNSPELAGRTLNINGGASVTGRGRVPQLPGQQRRGDQ